MSWKHFYLEKRKSLVIYRNQKYCFRTTKLSEKNNLNRKSGYGSGKDINLLPPVNFINNIVLTIVNF